jgi:hypothetical protein
MIFDICQRRVTLALTLGGWEELAAAGHDKPMQLERTLRDGSWRLDQVLDVLGVALRGGDSGLTVSTVVEAHGLVEAAGFAHAAVMAGLVPADKPARKKKPPSQNSDSA